MPELFVFAGCNGAGKSSLIEGLQFDFGQLINPDIFAREINPENPRKADLAAGKMAVNAIQKCFEAKESFAVETTLSGKYILNQMRRAKENGYAVHFYYIGLHDIQTHIDRVRTRVIEGGHHIDTEDIIRRYDLSLGNLNEAASLADTLVILDNTTAEYELLLEKKGEIESFRSSHWPSWLSNAYSDLL